jgi:3-oxoacyl-(acyl-carrier-protein) synthase
VAERVFVAAATVKCPGVSEVSDLAALATGRRTAPLQAVAFGDDEILIGEAVGLERDSPYYPPRSSEKLMRREVLAATIGVAELLARVDVPSGAAANIPLFVASGTSMEGHTRDLDWLSNTFRALTDCSGDAQWNKRLMQLTPPLLAVKTLTNAAASFVAERTHVAGNNTTFGSTSIGGFYALNEAFHAIATGNCPMCLVGAASRGGIVSHVTYRNFRGERVGWRESAAAVFLLLENEASLAARGATPLCELTTLRSAGGPRVTNSADGVPFSRFAPYGADGSLAVYSGAFCESEFRELKHAVSTSWTRSAALFPAIGNTGAANIFLGILTGIGILPAPCIVDCLDRDPYSRESFVRALVH